MGKRDDLTGRTFGRLEVLERVGTDKYRYALWRCKCSCGSEPILRGSYVKSGHTQSCGCLQREARVKSGQQQRHGQSAGDRSPTYRSWISMRSRCRNPHNVAYLRYGGRGIVTCERWDVFENFLADMGERPADCTIDRIDNDGNYEPGNCRWATYQEQANNRRRPQPDLLRFDFSLLTEYMTAEWLRQAADYLDRHVA